VRTTARLYHLAHLGHGRLGQRRPSPGRLPRIEPPAQPGPTGGILGLMDFAKDANAGEPVFAPGLGVRDQRERSPHGVRIAAADAQEHGALAKFVDGGGEFVGQRDISVAADVYRHVLVDEGRARLRKDDLGAWCLNLSGGSRTLAWGRN